MSAYESSELIRKESVEEIVAQRDQALALAEQGLALLAQANAAYKAATCRGYSMFADFGHSDWYCLSDDSRTDDLMKKLTKTIDQETWQYLLDASGLRNLMDAQTVKQFNEQVKKDPPAMTVDNVKSSFRSLWEARDSTFRQGLVNVFKELLGKYKSHDAFKIGKKAIIERALSVHGGWSFYSSARDKIADLDRIFHVLDNKEPKDHRADAAAMVSEASYKKLNEVDTEYFSFRLFQNGNVHVIFKNPFLVEKANKLIAEHYGKVLPG